MFEEKYPWNSWVKKDGVKTRDVEAAIFETLLLPPLALPLLLLDDVTFVYNFLVLKVLGKNFFQTSQDKTV